MRLDQYLVERGYYPSRERARRAVMAGEVRVVRNGRVLKPGEEVGDSGFHILKYEKPLYVSRGGEKLANALDEWGLEVDGARVLDIGSSTGGFTDCLLQRGALRVTALDVGEGQLHWKLRNDRRVTVMERVNARYLRVDMLPYRPDLVCIDVSFISVRLIFQALMEAVDEGCRVIALVKPQFEAGRGQVGRKGVIRDNRVHLQVLVKTRQTLEEMGFFLHRVTEAIPRGRQGNREFMTLWVKGVRPPCEPDLEAVCAG